MIQKPGFTTTLNVVFCYISSALIINFNNKKDFQNLKILQKEKFQKVWTKLRNETI